FCWQVGRLPICSLAAYLRAAAQRTRTPLRLWCRLGRRRDRLRPGWKLDDYPASELRQARAVEVSSRLPISGDHSVISRDERFGLDRDGCRRRERDDERPYALLPLRKAPRQ